ncbi:MAG: ferritin family protein [Magnetococcales bacterium]|nr:ferritin family protein [Magnetococcales bacterium]
MADVTNSIDLFKNALWGEVKASRFYQLASELTQNDEARMLFLSMIDTEDGHAHDLVHQAGQATLGAKFDAAGWLKEVEANVAIVMTPEEEKTVRDGTLRDVLQMAINFENQARDNYLSLRESLTDETLRRQCLELAQQEDAHQRTLVQLMDSLAMDPEDRPGL